MIWQDYLFSVGLVALIFGLIPMLRAPEKPPLLSSIPMTLVFVAFTISFATLNLWLSAVLEAGQVVGWTVLIVQRYRS